jgi:hypothetical protein
MQAAAKAEADRHSLCGITPLKGTHVTFLSQSPKWLMLKLMRRLIGPGFFDFRIKQQAMTVIHGDSLLYRLHSRHFHSMIMAHGFTGSSW